MRYYINPSAMFGAFMLPSAVVDKHIKMAGTVQLKVLLYIFRHASDEISAEAVSSYLSVPAADVDDALRFWVDAGILACEGDVSKAVTVPTEKPKAIRAVALKPTREEIARRGAENPQIAYLLREAQQKFGRTLKQSEASSLVWLHDDEGMSVSVLLMVIDFAISDGKLNIGYIERTALSWLDNGVEDIQSAEAKITEIYKSRTCWAEVERAFGIERRKPTDKELRFATLWIDERGQKPLLSAAYERSVDNTGKLSMPYIAKVLDGWFREGIKKPEDIDKKSKNPATGDSMATYDRDLFDAMVSAIDDE